MEVSLNRQASFFRIRIIRPRELVLTSGRTTEVVIEHSCCVGHLFELLDVVQLAVDSTA